MSKDNWEGKKFKGWAVGKRLGEGGNGIVYRATRAGQEGAIKILKRERGWWTRKQCKRFADEIEGMRRCEGISGVIPLLEFNAPEKPSKNDPPWIVMGLAEPLTDALGKKPKLEQVVEACLKIAEALAAMHAIGLAHRDIKPDNLFKFDGRWVVGDFGLIDFEGKAAVTAEGEKLGPTFYIAPEMLNNANAADGQAADVHSFAKTLWVLATGQKYPLPGEMRRTIDALTISAYVKHSRAPLLDPVIEAATWFDPAKRLKMEEIVNQLKYWLYPQVSPIGVGEPDLSKYAGEIEGMRARYIALRDGSNERAAYAEREGLRVRELLRPSVQDIAELLKRGGFLPSVNIDNVKFGFEISLHIRPIPGIRETNLRLFGGVHIGDGGRATFRCSSGITVNDDGNRNPTYEIWNSSATFLLGGSEEQPAIDKVFVELKAQLQRFAEQMLATAKGEEYTPTQSQEK
jgi:serine/threonine protein kinase